MSEGRVGRREQDPLPCSSSAVPLPKDRLGDGGYLDRTPMAACLSKAAASLSLTVGKSR
jgi:hypothetical protein